MAYGFGVCLRANEHPLGALGHVFYVGLFFSCCCNGETLSRFSKKNIYIYICIYRERETYGYGYSKLVTKFNEEDRKKKRKGLKVKYSGAYSR